MGDKSWSIDMQRYNFQFTGQRFFRIEGGKLVGQVKDVAYQATTTDFWGAMEAVGGPSTYVLGGAFNCGKAQPGQVAPIGDGDPGRLLSAVLEGAEPEVGKAGDVAAGGARAEHPAHQISPSSRASSKSIAARSPGGVAEGPGIVRRAVTQRLGG